MPRLSTRVPSIFRTLHIRSLTLSTCEVASPYNILRLMFLAHAHKEMAEETEDTSGDSTDVFSSKFDPLKAFYADEVTVPDANAPIFDNISIFESFCLKGLKAKAVKKDTKKEEGKRSTSRSMICQGLTKSVSAIRRNEKNVVNRMAKYFGPLSCLYQYMENKIKVKVHTRRINGIRGYIEAYIVAFDTHWNLALEDCTEVWTRKTARKTLNLGNANKNVAVETPICYTTVVKKKNKKMETVERHVHQLLLRGEQVVLIEKLE